MGTKAALQKYDGLVQTRVRFVVKRIAEDSKDITKQMKL
jgi:hypothetical protein